MYQDAIPERIASGIRAVAGAAADASALCQGVEAALAPALQAWGIRAAHRHRRADGPLVRLRGRAQAMYEAVVIAYEPPGALAHAGGVEPTRCRLERALAARRRPGSAEPRPAVGIGLDGERIFFLQSCAGAADARRNSGLAADALVSEPPLARGDRGTDFHLLGPYRIGAESCLALLVYLRALHRRPLTAASIADALGPQAAAARDLVGGLYGVLLRGDNPAVRSRFAAWDPLCGQLYGDALRRAPGAVAAMARSYGLAPDAAPKPLLCAVQTYYALVVKLLTVELVTLRRGAVLHAPLARLAALEDDDLRAWLTDLESGHLFARWGVLHYLDGDTLSWYLPGWNDSLESGVRALARTLGDFEPATGSLEPTAPFDPLRVLYQLLVPRALRRALNERFTPAWMAELLLTEAGYDGALDQRLLDPVCGFGAVLTQAIGRARRWADEQLLEPAEVVGHLLANVGGFELNPLAAITARTNYLFALEALVGHANPLEVPVYQRDSLLGPDIHTKPFQYVVGNPPWATWETLSVAYREATRPLLERYGLAMAGGGPRGRGERSHAISLLFTRVCADRYLAGGGTLAFLLAQAALRASTDHGSQRFQLGHGPALGVDRVSNLQDLGSLDDARTPPCAVVLTKGRTTTYPVPYVVWNRLSGKPFEDDTPLATVRALTTRRCLAAEPVRPDDPSTPWLTAPIGVLQALRAARGQAAYAAQVGLVSGARGTHRVRVRARLPNGTLVVERQGSRGRGRTRPVRALVAPDRVYALIRGRDVARWRCAPSAHLLVPRRWAPARCPQPAAQRCEAPRVSRGLVPGRPLMRRPGQRGRVAQPSHATGRAHGCLYAAHRVVWRRTGAALAAAVVPPARRHAVPNGELAVVPCCSAAEAYFLAGALNSAVARVIVAASLIEPSVPVPVLRWVRVPRFAAGDARHQALAALSRRAHALARQGDSSRAALQDVEAALDQQAAAMWGIAPEQLVAIQEALAGRE